MKYKIKFLICFFSLMSLINFALNVIPDNYHNDSNNYLFSLLNSTHAWAVERTPNILVKKTKSIDPKTSLSNLQVTDLNQLTINKLIYELVGDGTEIKDVKYIGAKHASGLFGNGTHAGLEMDSGILLTSGDVKNAVGPNDSNSKSRDNGLPGDSDLTAFVDRQTHDASILEFKFKPKSSNLNFDFVFASEEYTEFVGSSYNDVFAFFVNGTNIALVPGTNEYISINNVNQNKNAQYFVENPPSNPLHNIQYDGFTKKFIASSNVFQNQWNSIRIAISDTSDGIYDSAVFIKSGTFISTYQINFDPIAEQKINEPFKVKLKITDQLGKIQKYINGTVKFESMGLFEPMQCQVQNGEAECLLTFYTSQNNAQVKASINHNGNIYEGFSNLFDIKSPSEIFSKLIIQVVDSNGNPIKGAAVTPNIVGSTKETNAYGFVEFIKLTPQAYIVKAEKEGYMPENRYGFLLPGSTTEKIELTEIRDHYVIFVPGTFGSKQSGITTPGLPKSFAKSSDLKLFWPSKVGWNALEDQLNGWGYTVKEFPYDWRLYPSDKEIVYNSSKKDEDKRSPVDELENLITEIKNNSNTNVTIDLVGHSLGGLVILSYLDLHKMDNINKVAFVGTPLKGTLNFYGAVTFGDILANDMLTKSNSPDFLSKTVNKLYKTKEDENLYSDKIGSPAKYLVNVSDIQKWLNNETNCTLYKIGNPTFSNSVQKNSEDETLENIHLSSLYNPSENKSLGSLSTENAGVFYATNSEKETVYWFDHDLFLKSDNKSDPKIVKKSKAGDGLTLKNSALFPESVNISTHTKTVSGDRHSKLVKEFADDIVEFLNNGRNLVQKVIPYSYSGALSDPEENALSITIQGFVAPMITIDTQKSGYDLEHDETYFGDNLIEFTRKDNYSSLWLNNISSGSFDLKITGKIPHDIFLNIEGIINGKDISLNETVFFHGDPINLEFFLNPDGKLEIVNLPGTPGTISSQSYGSANHLTRLSWSAVPGAQKYRIYAKNDQQFKYSIIEEVGGAITQFDTNDAWDGEPRYYRVSAVDNKGNESFLTYQVTNKTIEQFYVPEAKPSLPAINLLLLSDN